jgi:hypothetical protein
MRELFAVLGIVLVGYSYHRFNSTTIFPGPAALVPTLGASLILMTGTKITFVSRILSWKPIAFIGLVSYSLYLVHWPLIVFARLGIFPLPTHWLGRPFVELIIMFLIAVVSWRLVEQPFRSRSLLSRPQLFRGFALASAVFGVAALIVIAKNGLPSRYPASALQVAQYLDRSFFARQGDCFITSGYHFDADFKEDVCTTEKSSVPNDLLLGDSHAAMFWSPLTRALPSTNIEQVTTSGCLVTVGKYNSSNCGRMRQYVFERYLRSHAPRRVILAQGWPIDKNLEIMTPTILWFKAHSIPVTLIGPVPEYVSPLPWLLARAIRSGDTDLPARYRIAGFDDLDQRLAEKARSWGVPYLSINSEICHNKRCRVYVDDANTIPMMSDGNHLSPEGAQWVMNQWMADSYLR